MARGREGEAGMRSSIGWGTRILIAIALVLAGLVGLIAWNILEPTADGHGLALRSSSASTTPATASPPSGRDSTVLTEGTIPKATLMMVGDVLVHQLVWESGEQSDGTRNYDHLFANVADDARSAGAALADYTDELAVANGVQSTAPDFSVQACKGLCTQALGPGFDQTTCSLKGRMS